MLRYIASLALLLACIWLLLSGMWTHPILLPLGLFSVLFSVWLSHRLGIFDDTPHLPRLLIAALRYWPWLLVQIVKSNFHVARRILTPQMEISPRIARLRTSQRTDLGRAILANSITLTPGTVSIHVRRDEIWFYALDEESANGTLSGAMDARVHLMEERSQ